MALTLLVCLDVIIEPLLYISDTFLGRVISQSNGIYSGTTIIAGAKSDHINSYLKMPQAGIELGLQ